MTWKIQIFIQTNYKDRLNKLINIDSTDLKEWSVKLENEFPLGDLPTQFDALLSELGISRDAAESVYDLPLDPVADKPIYSVSSAYYKIIYYEDPSLDAKFGFRDYGIDSMIVTCDYGAPTKISEVIFKKLKRTQLLSDLVNKFRLEYQEDGEWLMHGEFETGMTKDGVDDAYHVKLDKPIYS